MKPTSLAIAALLALLAATAAEEESPHVVTYDFETPDQAWRLFHDGKPDGAPCLFSHHAADGARALSIPVSFPGSPGAGVMLWRPDPKETGPRAGFRPPAAAPASGQSDAAAWRRTSQDKPRTPIGSERDDLQRAVWGRWQPFRELSLKVFLPADAPADVRAIVGLKDNDLNYYQHFRARALVPGRWTDIRLDLTTASRDWEPRGHFKPWTGYCRQDVNEISIKFTSRAAYEGEIGLDTVALHHGPDEKQPNHVYNLRPSAVTVPHYGRFELSFNIARTYPNPFDPEVVDVVGHFIDPDGKVESVPGFFYQGYRRTREAGAEKLIPMGRTHWKVRYAPRKTGRYHYYVTVNDGETIRTDTSSFYCQKSDSHGFIRMSKSDPRYFEFDDGSFYYPIGHNIAAVRDTRAESMGVFLSDADGTYAYDRLMAKMAAAGENFGRIWMAPWSFEIEWTKDYNSHYAGLGRYSLHNAWRLDHVLDTAAEDGLYIMLLIASHGEITNYESNFCGSPNKVGGRWPHPNWGSPYWQYNGGALPEVPTNFYTDPTTLRYYRNQARYIAARWGYSTAVMAWEILNEPDLAHFFRSNNNGISDKCAAFVSNIIRHMRENDPARHLATTGLYAHWEPHTLPVLRIKEMDFFAGHVFRSPMPRRMRTDYEEILQKAGKVTFITEADFSPHPRGADLTLRSVRVSLWGSFMMPQPGTACPWWWVLIDQKDGYGSFKALAAFARGEERRGQDYASIDAAVVNAAPSSARHLGIECMGNKTRAFCWVYNHVAFSEQSAWTKMPLAEATVRVPGLSPGHYIVEVWDTTKGSVITSLDAESRGGVLSFRLPAFEQDIACKIMQVHRPGEPRGPRLTPSTETHTLPE